MTEKVLATTRLHSYAWTYLPKEIRAALGIRKGDSRLVWTVNEGRVRVRRKRT